MIDAGTQLRRVPPYFDLWLTRACLPNTLVVQAEQSVRRVYVCVCVCLDNNFRTK